MILQNPSALPQLVQQTRQIAIAIPIHSGLSGISKPTTTQYARQTSRRIGKLATGAMGRLHPKSPVPSDIEIAQEAKPAHISKIAEELGVEPAELEQYGHMKAKVFSFLASDLARHTATSSTHGGLVCLQVNLGVLSRLKDAPLGKYGRGLSCNAHAQSRNYPHCVGPLCSFERLTSPFKCCSLSNIGGFEYIASIM